MKKRDIILDFTSLLDVTLIVIFFFVIFSHLDGEEKTVKVNEKIYDLEVQIQEAEVREAEADELAAQLEKEIEIVENSDKRRASNQKEILEFNKSDNVKVILDIDNEKNWSVRVLKHNKILEVIKDTSFSEEKFVNVLQSGDCNVEDTIFCEFIYDSSLSGSLLAYRKMRTALDAASKEYTCFYCSETDLSIGE